VILDAIESGDPDAAERAMVEHLSSLEVVYRKIWRPGTGAAD
jgi:DNA-binding GntR family transcriptional regulator